MVPLIGRWKVTVSAGGIWLRFSFSGRFIYALNMVFTCLVYTGPYVHAPLLFGEDPHGLRSSGRACYSPALRLNLAMLSWHASTSPVLPVVSIELLPHVGEGAPLRYCYYHCRSVLMSLDNRYFDISKKSENIPLKPILWQLWASRLNFILYGIKILCRFGIGGPPSVCLLLNSL